MGDVRGFGDGGFGPTAVWRSRPDPATTNTAMSSPLQRLHPRPRTTMNVNTSISNNVSASTSTSLNSTRHSTQPLRVSSCLSPAQADACDAADVDAADDPVTGREDAALLPLAAARDGGGTAAPTLGRDRTAVGVGIAWLMVLSWPVAALPKLPVEAVDRRRALPCSGVRIRCSATRVPRRLTCCSDG